MDGISEKLKRVLLVVSVETEKEFLESIIKDLSDLIKKRILEGAVTNYDYAVGGGQRRFERMSIDELEELRGRKIVELKLLEDYQADGDEYTSCYEFE